MESKQRTTVGIVEYCRMASVTCCLILEQLLHRSKTVSLALNLD